MNWTKTDTFYMTLAVPSLGLIFFVPTLWNMMRSRYFSGDEKLHRIPLRREFDYHGGAFGKEFARKCGRALSLIDAAYPNICVNVRTSPVSPAHTPLAVLSHAPLRVVSRLGQVVLAYGSQLIVQLQALLVLSYALDAGSRRLRRFSLPRRLEHSRRIQKFSGRPCAPRLGALRLGLQQVEVAFSSRCRASTHPDVSLERHRQ